MYVSLKKIFLVIGICCPFGGACNKVPQQTPSPDVVAYEVSLEREGALVSGCRRLKQGMTLDQVTQIMGPPDLHNTIYVADRDKTILELTYFITSTTKLRAYCPNVRDGNIVIMFDADKKLEHVVTGNVLGLPEFEPPLSTK